MTSLVLFLAGLLVLPVGTRAQPVTDSTNELLLTNARLVDPETQTIERGALHIEGERIAAVRDNVPSRFDGQTLDVDGKWVVPGLVDAHVHSWGNTGPALKQRQMLETDGTAKIMLYSGVTAVLDLFSPEEYIFTIRNRQRTEGLLGADIYAAGPILTCPNGHGTQYGIQTRTVSSAEDARATVDALAKRHPDVVKLAYHPYRTERDPSMDEATMTAIVEAARQHDLTTVAHIESWRGAHEAIDGGVTAITHTPPAPLPDSTAALIREKEPIWIPTLAVHTELASLLNTPQRLENGLLRAVADSSLRAAYRDTSNLPAPITSWIRRQSTHDSTRLNAVRTGAEHGARIVAGTDAGNPGLFQGYSLHRELQLLVDAGLSNWDALAAATTRAGPFLNAPFGLHPGDRANLLILNASPIDDIHHTQEIRHVIYRGQVVNRRSLLQQATTSGPAMPSP